MIADLQRRESKVDSNPVSQIQHEWETPLSQMFGSSDAFQRNYAVYEMVRKSVPFVNRAIKIYCLLLGTFEIQSTNPKVEQLINDWLKDVRVNDDETGIGGWIKQLMDSALEQGDGFGESVLTPRVDDIYKLANGSPENIGFMYQNGELITGQRQAYFGKIIPFPNQELIYHAAFDRRKGNPHGYSMIYSLPFMSQVFQRIIKAIDNQLIRSADPSLAVVVKPGVVGGADTRWLDAMFKAAKDTKSSLESQFEKMMQLKSKSKMGDLFLAAPPGGDVDFRLINAGNTLMDLSIPVRTILEQIVAETGIPAFVFSVSWSTTERMSSEQRDILTANIGGYRNVFNPIIQRVIDLKLALSGYSGTDYEIVWGPMGLRDEETEAKTSLYTANANSKQIESLIKLLELELIDFEDARELLSVITGTELKTAGEALNGLKERHFVAQAARLSGMLS